MFKPKPQRRQVQKPPRFIPPPANPVRRVVCPFCAGRTFVMPISLSLHVEREHAGREAGHAK